MLSTRYDYATCQVPMSTLYSIMPSLSNFLAGAHECPCRRLQLGCCNLRAEIKICLRATLTAPKPTQGKADTGLAIVRSVDAILKQYHQLNSRTIIYIYIVIYIYVCMYVCKSSIFTFFSKYLFR
ncbi:hypothetical protein LZ32DRAFT_127085 [Colletotrichum eremochloae]|nr:hypothetical protein LZ32DRAFT_127085 [Colletotrichum eremochloae]